MENDTISVKNVSVYETRNFDYIKLGEKTLEEIKAISGASKIDRYSASLVFRGKMLIYNQCLCRILSTRNFLANLYLGLYVELPS